MERSILQLFSGDYGDLNAGQMKNTVNALLEQIFPRNPEIRQQILVALDYVDEDGNEWNIDSQIDKIYEQLGGEVTLGDDGKKHYYSGESNVLYAQLTGLT